MKALIASLMFFAVQNAMAQVKVVCPAEGTQAEAHLVITKGGAYLANEDRGMDSCLEKFAEREALRENISPREAIQSFINRDQEMKTFSDPEFNYQGQDKARSKKKK